MYEYSEIISMANEKMTEAHRYYCLARQARTVMMATRMEIKADEAAQCAARWFERAKWYNWKHAYRYAGIKA